MVMDWLTILAVTPDSGSNMCDGILDPILSGRMGGSSKMEANLQAAFRTRTGIRYAFRISMVTVELTTSILVPVFHLAIG